MCVPSLERPVFMRDWAAHWDGSLSGVFPTARALSSRMSGGKAFESHTSVGGMGRGRALIRLKALCPWLAAWFVSVVFEVVVGERRGLTVLRSVEFRRPRPMGSSLLRDRRRPGTPGAQIERSCW
jgi:hypothetical protein